MVQGLKISTVSLVVSGTGKGTGTCTTVPDSIAEYQRSMTYKYMVLMQRDRQKIGGGKKGQAIILQRKSFPWSHREDLVTRTNDCVAHGSF